MKCRTINRVIARLLLQGGEAEVDGSHSRRLIPFTTPGLCFTSTNRRQRTHLDGLINLIKQFEFGFVNGIGAVIKYSNELPEP